MLFQIDPVCRMEVDPTSTKEKCTWQGKEYFFCHFSCKQKFQADPGNYLEGLTQPNLNKKNKLSNHPGRFICVMCPEVSDIKPGNCPKCGMSLEGDSIKSFGGRNEIGKKKFIQLSIAFLFWFPLLVEHWRHESKLFPWFAFIDSSIIVFGFGFSFLFQFLKSLWPGPLNMFSLVGLGVLATQCLSYGAFFSPSTFGTHTYFESSAGIVVLMLTGQLIEGLLRQGTGKAILALVHEIPISARVVIPGIGEKDLPTELLQKGDQVRVLVGEKIPLDGIVLDGNSSVEEAMITGEPFPRQIVKGDKVFAGSINMESPILLEATAAGSESLIHRILNLVEQAQRTRLPIQNSVDKIASWLAPGVIILSLAVFFLWVCVGDKPWQMSLVNSLSVLVIACPCALGLATPMAVWIGLTRGATMGILVRRGEELEALSKVKTVLFDKTGTLTEGKPRLAEISPFGELSANEILALAGGLGKLSRHPLSLEIYHQVLAKNLFPTPISEPKEHAGLGIMGKCPLGNLVLGRKEFLIQTGIDEKDFSFLPQIPATNSIVWLGLEGKLIGLFSFRDRIKPTTPEAINFLKKENLQLIMLTGDTISAGEHVAKELNLDGYHAGLTPEDKVKWVEHYSNGGQNPVAMAGDGINDAAALSRANVSIAMGTGTDLAKETAGITLVAGDLKALANARALGIFTTRAIWQNLTLAFLYNLIALPIAALGLLSPLVAGFAMALSSISVLANSLRLSKVSLVNHAS